MSLSLIKRASNGAPITANQNDSNMTAIETAVNTNTSNIATNLAITARMDYFSGWGLTPGRPTFLNVSWLDVINKPSQFSNAGVFKATKTDAVQTISASGSLTVHFPTENFDFLGNYDPSTYTFSPTFSGVFYVGASVQVSLASGSPTAVSIIANIKVNGAAQEQATLDNTGTGTRIYKLGSLFSLTAGDLVTVTMDFSFSGTATWQVDANNTVFFGNRVNTN